MKGFDKLYNFYKKGFDDELKGTSTVIPNVNILINAYKLGAYDALKIGDYRTKDDVIDIVIVKGQNEDK